MHKEQEQTFKLHHEFWQAIMQQKIKPEQVNKEIDVDKELYMKCVKIIEKDLDKWEGNVKSKIFNTPKHLAQVIAWFYYYAMLKSIELVFRRDYESEYKVGKNSIMYFDKAQSINKITKITGLSVNIVCKIVEYLINDGKPNFLEFPLFEINGKLITIPALIMINDWQFSIVNGHYLKNIPIINREHTISEVTEKRIAKVLSNVSNVAVAKTVPYSFKDEKNNEISSDIDYAIYDFKNNTILIIEAKWIDKHYKDPVDKRYGKIFETLNKVYVQIDKHKKFLAKSEHIDFVFKGDKKYAKEMKNPDIHYLAVDKRNQLHIQDKHMISEYMLVFFLNKYTIDGQLNLKLMCSEIEELRTKVDYISSSDNYYEIQLKNCSVLVEEVDLGCY